MVEAALATTSATSGLQNAAGEQRTGVTAPQRRPLLAHSSIASQLLLLCCTSAEQPLPASRPTISVSRALDAAQAIAVVLQVDEDQARRGNAHVQAVRAVYFMNFFIGARFFIVEPNTMTFVGGNPSHTLNPPLFAPHVGTERTSLFCSCATLCGNLRCQWLHRVFCGA